MKNNKIKKTFADYNKFEFEDLCNKCGACCGAYDNDPCVHLKRIDNNRYICEIYKNREGFHRTVNGNRIKCVPIMKKLEDGPWIGDGLCSYKKILRSK